uniref:Pelovaterin n=1 Tax=Podoviridae sp. ctWeH21 TaxID=2825255 RepID=A0A8S5PFA8_9CAUD|nr:MAG TPA: Pelovaterin [Podoviridae sp. ctWeH21]
MFYLYSLPFVSPFLFDFDCSVLIDHATVGCSGRK